MARRRACAFSTADKLRSALPCCGLARLFACARRPPEADVPSPEELLRAEKAEQEPQYYPAAHVGVVDVELKRGGKALDLIDYLRDRGVTVVVVSRSTSTPPDTAATIAKKPFSGAALMETLGDALLCNPGSRSTGVCSENRANWPGTSDQQCATRRARRLPGDQDLAVSRRRNAQDQHGGARHLFTQIAEMGQGRPVAQPPGIEVLVRSSLSVPKFRVAQLVGEF
jgi:hypothetical protein